jgi:amidase
MPAHFCGVYAHKPTLGLVPLRGYNPPPFPPAPACGDLAVAGPMARTAGDLALALAVIAGPDEEYGGIGYRLTLRPARHDKFRDFRVVVVDTHPLVPTDNAVRTAIDRLSERLARTGVKVAHTSARLPDLANSARLYMRLLGAAKSASLAFEHYEAARRSALALAPDDTRLASERTRGAAMSHRYWLAADRARARLRVQWAEFFREWDLLLYPAAAVPAFPNDHSVPVEARSIDIDGKPYNYYDACFVWADPATTCGLPATAVPIDRSPTGLPIGMQIIGPYLEDSTTLVFAELLEREFGGFVSPPSYMGQPSPSTRRSRLDDGLATVASPYPQLN